MPDNLMSGRDIVVVGQQPWDVSIGSNCKNIAIEFSKHNRVLYVNSALDRATIFRNKGDKKIARRKRIIHGKEEGLVQVEDNIWNLYPDVVLESVTWIKHHRVFNSLNRMNNKRFAGSIKKAIRQLNFHNYILFNDNDIYRSFYLPELLAPACSIYYSRDYMLAVEYWRRHGEVLEPLLIGKSDLCVANSTYLAAYCAKYNSNSFYVGQGCELDLFDPALSRARPAEFNGITGKIIGYVGALQTLRLDIDTIKHIATQHRDWNVVLVGPEDDGFQKSDLHNIDNVIFMGAKTPQSLPAYINAFDVCLNPQILNEVTIGNYPRKIDEYLSMGKATVATKTMAMEIFSEHVYLAENRQAYVQLIEKALNEDSPLKQEARRNFALSHSWEQSVNEIYKAIIAVNKN